MRGREKGITHHIACRAWAVLRRPQATIGKRLKITLFMDIY